MKFTFAQHAAAVAMPLAVAVMVCGALWATASEFLPARLFEGPQLVSVARSPNAAVQAQEGDTVAAEFTVKNVTDESLRLLGANTSCGCTIVATEFPKELQPGESTILKVQMTVEKPEADGTFTQEAYLLVNREGMVPPLVIEAAVSHF